MNRITQKDLEQVIRVINTRAGFDPDAVSWNTVGAYKLDGAYGGWRLDRIESEGGGIRAITSGYRPKRELYDLMHAFLRGMEVNE